MIDEHLTWPWHVAFLAELMRAGFRTGSKIEFCEFERRRYLVNGQHTLMAIVRAGLTQDLRVPTGDATEEAA